MKTVILLLRKNVRILLYCIFMVSLTGLYSCQEQDEFATIAPDEVVGLKNGGIPPTPGIGIWEVSLPENWNYLPERYLVIFAHGMVFPNEPLALPNDKIGDKLIKTIVNEMGFGYAATSYEANGLVANLAVENVHNLRNLLQSYLPENGHSLPDYWIIAGPSEGGLVTVLTLEKYPQDFDGGLSVCGPIGSFYDQLQFMGDYNVLYNYFFGTFYGPGTPVPDGLGSPLGIPLSAMVGWTMVPSPLQAYAASKFAENPLLTAQLINCSKATIPVNEIPPEAVGSALMHLLSYNIMLTQNVTSLLHGCIFNNKYPYRLYTGSANDLLLNMKIQRIKTADFAVAKANLSPLETTGNIRDPLVTLHTTGDYLVPVWHQFKYRLKVWSKGKALLYTGIPVQAFGHCTISEGDLQNAITILVTKMKLIDALACQ